MCTSPLLVNNPSVYRHPLYTTQKVSVSCGKCLECRSAYMSDWQTRLAFELDALYKRGGVAIFLTIHVLPPLWVVCLLIAIIGKAKPNIKHVRV